MITERIQSKIKENVVENINKSPIKNLATIEAELSNHICELESLNQSFLRNENLVGIEEGKQVKTAYEKVKIALVSRIVYLEACRELQKNNKEVEDILEFINVRIKQLYN